jgi:hypothetical protein
MDAVNRRLADKSGSGGNFYATQRIRMSPTFMREVIRSTLEGRTLYTDAFSMLGFRSTNTFNKFAASFGLQ